MSKFEKAAKGEEDADADASSNMEPQQQFMITMHSMMHYTTMNRQVPVTGASAPSTSFIQCIPPKTIGDYITPEPAEGVEDTQHV